MKRRCQVCAAELPEDSPGNRCPRCLLELGLGETTPEAPDTAPGDVIGRYKLLQQIGEGGFGIVYMAEQKEPVKRRVALKVIKVGMDTKQVVARFEAERQALAMMDHPNIAKVFDGGATENARLYFVMELVRGIPITKYCDENNLTTRERLELFLAVCSAIQHAHQKGIIHRDIKPSNVLVTLHDGEPVPKVIDFGIAKATQQELTDKTIFTQFHQMIGTPAYMSPEQAEMSGLDIDTRSDIYSLGVLLYELLVGKTPLDTRELINSGYDEIRRRIKEEEPVRPSTRLKTLEGEERTTIAKHRKLDPAKLGSDLRGDVDWIIMKSLEKDRRRRYETANGLAMDLQRHLSNEPVLARPPSNLYRLQKAYQRNKRAFASAAAILAVLIAGIVASTWQAARATRAQQVADAARKNESQLRSHAEAQALAERQRAYASDLNLLQQALAINNLGRAQELLDRQIPKPGQKDLRGWEWRYLWGQCQTDPFVQLCQMTNHIASLAISHDGKWLAIGESQNGGLSIWDLATRRQMMQLPAGNHDVRVAFSPRELLLAFTFENLNGPTNHLRGVCLWDGETKTVVATIPLGSPGYGLAFSADGRTLVVSTRDPDHQISLWSVRHGTNVATYPATQRTDEAMPTTAFAMSLDMTVAAHPDTGNKQGRLHVLDLRSGRERWTKVAAEEGITALSISPDGKMVASGAGFVESDIRLWDLASGAEIARLSGHRGWVSAILFWPDSKTMASASADQTVRIWDLSDKSNPRALRVLRGHKLEVWRLALLPDNATLVSGSKDGSVYLWDTRVPSRASGAMTLPAHVAAWRFAPDSRSILTLNENGRFEQWTGTDFQQCETLFEAGQLANPIWTLISRDARLAATVQIDGAVRIWDLQRRAALCEVRSQTGPICPQAFLRGGKNLVTRRLADFSFDEWNLASQAQVRSWRGVGIVNNWLNGCALSPDEDRFVMLDFHTGEGWVRDMRSERQSSLIFNFKEAAQAEFSRDGKLFAASSEIGFAGLWDAATFQPIATFSGFMLGTHSVAFSPDGTRLAVASDGNEAIKLWDVASHHDVLTLQGKGSAFLNTAFSPDGNILGSMTMGTGLLHLWRAPSWQEIATAEQPR